MSGFIDQKDIFDKTNGGLDIILFYFPQAEICVRKKNAKFKVRESEKTASANIKEIEGGIWVLTDFGGAGKSKNAIAIVQQEENLDFKPALDFIAAKWNVDPQKAKEFYKSVYTSRDAKPKEKEGFSFDFKDKFSDFELKTIGKQVTEEICKRYNLYVLKSYTIVKDGKAHTYASTENYPIYVYDYEEFQKIYQPLNQDKKYRFMYAGTRPKNYTFGLEQAKKRLADLERTTDESGDKAIKLDEIILCSGDRDAINVASLGYNVVWLNSETAVFTGKQYVEIARLTFNLYNLPDIDTTGIKQAHKLGLKFLDIKTIYLPEDLKKTRDFRGNFCKDVTDYINHYRQSKDNHQGTKKAFSKLVDTALPLRFWDEIPKFNTKKEYTHTDYKFNNVQAYYFLSVNGFARIENKNNKEGFDFVKIEENSVRILEDKNDMKAFIFDFLAERKLPTDLRNAFYKTPYLSEKSLSNLDKKVIDFNDFDKDTQFLFFENATWEVTKNGIKSYRKGEVKKYVWEEEIIKHRVKVLDPPFEITQENDSFNIDFKFKAEQTKPDCLFFNFLKNTSRVHWQKEENGKTLTNDEKQEENQHLVNKIYSLGYLLHKFKDPSKPWCVFAMDDKITDQGESHGGSGKSVCFKAVRHFMQSITFEGRNPKLTENNHIYDRVTKHTDYILIDDANQYVDFGFFFSALTGEMIVNPKSAKSYEIPFSDVPKFCITSNYPLRQDDPSTTRRLLYNVFSDYYHFNKDNEYKSTRTIRDEIGKNLFDDFTADEWNYFFNFMAHCLKFYLANGEKVNPPMENVNKRNLKVIMGDEFKNWADNFFQKSDLNHLHAKNDTHDLFIKQSGVQERYNTVSKFKKQLKAWGKYYGYEFNPEGRKNINVDGKVIEHFIIKSDKATHLTSAPAVVSPDQPNQPDLPF